MNNNLKKASKQLLALPKIVEKEFVQLSKELIKQIKETHNEQEDVYGKSWKPRKEKHSWPINKHTGKLFSSYDTKKYKNAFELINKAGYSGFVNKTRKLFIYKNSLPNSWKEIIQKKLNKKLKSELR